MASYFLAGLPADTESRLEKLGIDVFPYKLRAGGSVFPGLLVPEKDWEGIATELRLEKVNESPTDVSGVTQLIVKERPPDVEAVNYQGHVPFYCDKPQIFVDLAITHLVPLFFGKIRLFTPARYSVESKDLALGKDDFYIFINSTLSPSSGRRGTREPPGYIWGMRLVARETVWQPSGLGIPLVDRDKNYCVAELVGNNLFIHHNVCAYSSDNDAQIFERILQEATKVILAMRQGKITPQAVEAAKAYLKQMAETKFAREKERLQAAQASAELSLHQRQSQFDQAHFNLVSAVESARSAREKKEDFEKIGALQDEKLEQACLALSQVEGIVYFSFTDDNSTLLILTKVMSCLDPNSGKRHELGQFRIGFDIAGRGGTVTFFNTTRLVHGCCANMHAPHIHFDSSNLVGGRDYVAAVTELLAKNDWAAAVRLTFSFLENPSPDRAGYIQCWPEIKNP